MTADERGIWGDAVDQALGQLQSGEQAAFQQRMNRDPELVLASAEVRDLFERCRELTEEVPAEVGLPQRLLQLELQRRHTSRQHSPRQAPLLRLRDVAATIAVAAALLAAMILWQRMGSEDRPDGPGDGPVAQWVLPELPRMPAPLTEESPAGLPGSGLAGSPPPFAIGVDWNVQLPDEDLLALDSELPAGESDQDRVDRYARWVDAHNDMARMRAGYDNRRDSQWRRQVIARHGGNPDMEWRVRSLARALALKVRQHIGPGTDGDTLSVRDVALALRGLTAAGHAPGFGEHGDAAALCLAWLEDVLANDAAGRRVWSNNPGALERHRATERMLTGDQRTMVLAALAEVAALSGGPLADRVQGELASLCGQVVAEAKGDDPLAAGPRPGLLHLTTSSAALGEAGRLFAIAPALGCDGALAMSARKATAQWFRGEMVAERRAGPGVLAAMLYGFGEFVDRAAVDQELRLWRARWMLPDYTALHHLAWSRFPVQSGFADFQLLLRQVSGFATPEDVGDIGTLLMCLAANFAAPGAAPL